MVNTRTTTPVLKEQNAIRDAHEITKKRKAPEGYNNLDDRISQQTDDILVDILSRLTLKEAGRSCVLSKRWRDLWKSTTCLNFDALASVRKLCGSHSKKMILAERSKYVAWVNNILRLHEGSTIDEFRIQFHLNADASATIDEWIKFMMRKRAKRVEIDFTSYFGDNSYTLSHDHFKTASNLSNVLSLTSLSLGEVNVDGGLIGYLLSKCPHLEMLSISWSEHLVNLKVSGPSLPLKYLKVFRCDSLESIELSAPKLETFIYFGRVVGFVLGSNPCLANLGIGGGCREKTVTFCLGQFASYFSQLESLDIHMQFEGDSDIPHVPEFRNLKHLKLDIMAYSRQSLVAFTRFVVAAPSLAKLSLELCMLYLLPIKSSREKLPVQPHHCLKEIEVFGYSGCKSCFILARYLVESAVNLEKVVIDPRDRNGHLLPASEFQQEIAERRRKLQEDSEALTEVLPPGAKLTLNSV